MQLDFTISQTIFSLLPQWPSTSPSTPPLSRRASPSTWATDCVAQTAHVSWAMKDFRNASATPDGMASSAIRIPLLVGWILGTGVIKSEGLFRMSKASYKHWLSNTLKRVWEPKIRLNKKGFGEHRRFYNFVLKISITVFRLFYAIVISMRVMIHEQSWDYNNKV